MVFLLEYNEADCTLSSSTFLYLSLISQVKDMERKQGNHFGLDSTALGNAHSTVLL